MNVNEIEIGLQADCQRSDSPVVRHNLMQVLGRMAVSDKLKEKTQAVRGATTEDEKRRLKSKLHAMIVSSDTVCRKKSDGDRHTGFMWADLDKFGTDENPKSLSEGVAIVDDLVKDYPYIIGYFVSPSGNGLKVLCAIEPDVDSHRMSFKAVSDLFDANGLHVDKSGSDAKRVCYVCYDPRIQETLIEPLSNWGGERIKPAVPAPKKAYVVTRSSSNDMSADDEASACLQHISPDLEYHEWINVGMALKDHGCSVGVWDSWSSGSQLYKAGECDRKWSTFSGSGVGFGTLVQMAKDNNGGRNPIVSERNHQPPAVTSNDFDVVDVEDVVSVPAITLQNTYYRESKYYVLDATGKRYIHLNGDGLTRQLRMLGYSMKGEEGEMSAIDKFKAYVELHNTVDAVGVLAGRSIGLRGSSGTSMRYLVTMKNDRVKAKEGSWDNLRSILEAQYGDDQLRYLYAWLHRSRYQLEKEEFMQGHALTISGGVGGGKSLIIINVIKPLLGQMADAYQYLCKDNQFNGDLIGSEMLLIDDKPLSRKMEDRKVFGNQIKSIVAASSDVRCHRKGVDGFNTNPLWRIIIAINDTEQDLGAMPPLGEDSEDTIGDKVLMLKCFKSVLPYVGDKDQFAKLKALIGSEIEAFAHFIDNYETPAAIKQGDCRFGFDEYHHPDLLAVLNQNSNDRTLLSATSMALFDANEYDFNVEVTNEAGTDRKYWVGTAQEWSKILLSSRSIPHRVKGTIEGMLAFGDSAIKAGKLMSSMADISQGRVVKGRSKKGVTWTIWSEDDAEADPF